MKRTFTNNVQREPRQLNLLRHLFAVLVVMLITATILPAQTPQFHNQSNGGSNNIYPFGSTSTKMVEQHYLPGMFTGAYNGRISKVYWRRNTAGSSVTYTNLKIYLKQIPSSTFPSTNNFSTGMTLVYSGSPTVTNLNAMDWFGFQLTTPFSYDPSQSLIVQVCHEGYVGGGIQLRTASLTVPPYRRLWSAGCTTLTGSTDGNSYDFGFDLTSAFLDDAGIASLIAPVSFCTSTADVIISLMNYGQNPLTSCTINWTYDGTPQTPISWTGNLASLAQTPINLGNKAFAPGVPHTLVAWTTAPNGASVDSGSFNDSLTTLIKPAISGTYTIGGGGANYPDIQSAIDDAVANGICGPVVYKINNGTYNEHVDIQPIPGASAINTITIESMSGSRGDVTIVSAALGTADNYAIAMRGCDYVTVKNLTLRATNNTYATCALVQGGATYCTFENIDMYGTNSGTTGTYQRVFDSPDSQDNYLTVRGCKIVGGSYGMYLRGSGTTTMMENMLIENNEILEFGYMGIYAYYQDSPQYIGNTIKSSNTNYNYKYAAYMYYNYNALRFVGNTVSIVGPLYNYGVLCYYSVGSSSNYGIIANNFMTFNNGNTYYGYGLRTGYGSYTKVMNNTIYVKSNSTYYAMYTYNGNDYYYSNNISIYDGPGYAWYCYPGSNVVGSDYNVLWTNGSYLAYWNSTTHGNLAALQASSGKDQYSISKVPEFVSTSSGDLHLTGASEDDPALVGGSEPEVTVDIDNEPRVLPYRGADEACYITKGTVWFELTDGNGVQTPYANVPGTMGVHYHVGFPEFDATITITLRFYSIPNNFLTYTTSFQVSKAYGVELDGLQLVNLTGIPTGTYRVEATFNTKNSCGGYRDWVPPSNAFMLLPQGQQPCIVWPGDVNNDGIVNYGDRKSLNTYIQDANLSPIWLQGPSRYRADAGQNPLTYLKYEAQAAVPWQTPEGCYMDADGNGTVNSFDYIGIKMNWMRPHDGGVPKSHSESQSLTFDVAQNFPNPFNPTTQIQFSVPEPSHVRITVYDATGREVATVHNATAEAGIHSVTFNAQNLSSGIYTAVAEMQGETTGTTFTRAIQMNLSK